MADEKNGSAPPPIPPRQNSGSKPKGSPAFLDDAKAKALDVWRRAPTLVVVCGVALLLLCSTCCLCGGCMSAFVGTGSSSSGGGGMSSDRTTSARATHAVAEDACLYLFPASREGKGVNLEHWLRQQSRGDALAEDDADEAIVLLEGTGVVVKKTATGHEIGDGGRPADYYQVSFVEVVTGEYSGEQGWIHERFLLRK